MSSTILPKSRDNPSNANRHQATRNPSGSENLNLGKQRILSKRLASGNRVVSNNRVISGQRHVSRSLNTDDEDYNQSFEENAIRFDENKHTILSNFEEWIKLSTDNKITSKNSWQFALIDYFHDLNVIKDGENINFQRASATLDGCVKIYLSRVESVATETGKLLSGLAKKKNNTLKEDEEENEAEEENGEENEEDNTDESKKKRKINRVVESTLVPFDTIRIKKLEQELSIDPLFKKVLSELDEGGAKSLLLNTLNIDKYGRVIFDASTNSLKDETDAEENLAELQDRDLKVNTLGSFLFKDNEDLEDLSICPTMGQLNFVLQDVSNAKNVLTEMNNQFHQEGEILDNLKEERYDDDDDFRNDFDDFDAENFDNDINDQDPINNMNESIIQQVFNASVDYSQEVKSEKVLDRDLMAYFDERMKTNWRGPEHWKISAIKKNKKHVNTDVKSNTEQGLATLNRKKQKETTIINFLEDDPHDFEDIIFESPKNIQILNKPYSDNAISSKDLPEDIQYNSFRLTNLFTKPHLAIMSFSNIKKPKDSETKPLTDEAFFSNQYNNIEEEQDRLAASFHQAEFEDFNNDFGADDFGDVDFNDALGGSFHESKDTEKEAQIVGNTLIPGRRARPEYVNFSRTAKRVDVKLLKDNLWRSIKKENDVSVDNNEQSNDENKVKTFGEVITNISSLYGAEQKRDLSTSFCFICLLHLANEHSLSITTNEAYDDLKITGF